MVLSDDEYLKNPLLNNLTFRILNCYIKVETENTCFCNESRITEVDLDSVLKLYSNIYQMARMRHIVVGKTNRYKISILDNADKYKQEVQYYNNIFNQMIEQFLKVQERGIHYGCSDDVVLKEAIRLRNEYIKVYYRTSTYSKLNDIATKLQQIYNLLHSDANIAKIIL